MTMTKNNQTPQWPAAEPIDLQKSWLLDEASEPVEIAPKNPKKGFQLAELYEALDCDTIEVVSLDDSGLILIIDEEGKFKNHDQHNIGATLLWWELVPAAKHQDVILGKAIVCKTGLLK